MGVECIDPMPTAAVVIITIFWPPYTQVLLGIRCPGQTRRGHMSCHTPYCSLILTQAYFTFAWRLLAEFKTLGFSALTSLGLSACGPKEGEGCGFPVTLVF